MQTKIFEKRNITLPRGGGVLEVQMSEALEAIIRGHFDLQKDQSVNDDHVRMFIWAAVNNAVEKVEHEVENVAGNFI